MGRVKGLRLGPGGSEFTTATQVVTVPAEPERAVDPGETGFAGKGDSWELDDELAALELWCGDRARVSRATRGVGRYRRGARPDGDAELR